MKDVAQPFSIDNYCVIKKKILNNMYSKKQNKTKQNKTKQNKKENKKRKNSLVKQLANLTH